MTLAQGLQCLTSGITVGSIYGVVAIGFNITYNATGIINFAQGEFLMLGAMTAISLEPFLPLWLAVLAAVAITSLVGALVDLVFVKWVPRPTVLRLIIVTIGISILLREGALHVWDEKVRALPAFTGNEVSSIDILGAHIAPQVLWVLGVCAVTVLGLSLFFRLSLTGRAMRACAANPFAARLCGINVRRMVTMSFMLSAGIGALAGCVVAPITLAHYDMGASFAIKGFTVAVLGGLGNSMAAIWAGLLLGVLEELSIARIPFLWPGLPVAYQEAVSIAVLLIVLVFKPSGLFGDRRLAGLKEF